MGLKKLFSTKEKHKEKKQRESTRSSMSISRWTKKRPESFASHLSNPYEQDKIELPVTPSPSDDDSLQCSTKHVQDIPPSIDRLEFLVETCQQKNELLKNRLQTHEDTEDQIRALFNDTHHMPLISLFTMDLEQRERVEQDYRSEINRWSEHASQLEAERDRVAKNEKDLQNRLAILTELYEQSEREHTRLEYEKTQAEKDADLRKLENENLKAEYKALSKEKEISSNELLKEREEALKSRYEERHQILIARYEAMIKERDEAVKNKYMKIAQDKEDALEIKYMKIAQDKEDALEIKYKAEHKSSLKELEIKRKAFADLETQAANEKSAFEKLKDALTEREKTRASDLEEIRELKDIIRTLEQKPGKLLTRTKSTQQEELMRMHTKAQLGLIEYLEGEDDVIQAMSRFKRQLETDLC